MSHVEGGVRGREGHHGTEPQLGQVAAAAPDRQDQKGDRGQRRSPGVADEVFVVGRHDIDLRHDREEVQGQEQRSSTGDDHLDGDENDFGPQETRVLDACEPLSVPSAGWAPLPLMQDQSPSDSERLHWRQDRNWIGSGRLTS